MAENPRIEELRRRVQADPASIAFAALAEEFRRVGNYAGAIETCRTGLQRHPAYLSARVTLGRALIETGDYDGAREELETVLRSAPENLAAIRGLEQINERLGHSTEMHPDLHALAQEPIRVAPRPPAPEPPVAPQSPSAPEPTFASEPRFAPEPPSEPESSFVRDPPAHAAPVFSLDHFDLPLATSAAEADAGEGHDARAETYEQVGKADEPF